MYTFNIIMYTCILNYVYMQENYVYMQEKYVYMYTLLCIHVYIIT